MFEWIQKNQRVSQIILALIILPFAFFGIESFRARGGIDKVASVAGRPVYRTEFDYQVRERQNEMRQMLGENYNAALFDTPEMRKNILDQIVNRRVIDEAVRQSHIVASADALREQILEMPALQENGTFSIAKYESALKARGMTSAQFEADLAQSMALQQLVGGVSETGFVAQSTVKRLLDAQLEEREVSELRFPVAGFVDKVQVSADEIKTTYDADAALYELPARIKVEYVSLDMPSLEKGAVVSDDEIHKYYEHNKEARYQTPEERRARHILINTPAGANQEVQDKAKTKAEALLKKIRAGEDFAKLAQAESEDPGSKSKGGDLGFFGKGAMVKPFEDAAFSLAKGEVSNVVKSDFGYHIIQVTEVRSAGVKTFDQVKNEVKAELTRQKAQKLFAEQVDQFKNIVYEQSDSLKPAEDTFKLKAIKTDWINSNAVQIGVIQSPQLVQKLFSEDALVKKRNTEAVEVGKDTLVSARVLEHEPARRQSLDEVKEQIEKRLKQQKAQALSAEKAQAALTALKEGKSVEGKWTTGLKLQRAQPVLPNDALRSIFALPANTPSYVSVTLTDKSSAVFRLDKVTRATFDTKDERFKKLAHDLARQAGEQDLNLYLTDLRKRFDAEIFAKAIQNSTQH